MRTAILWFLTCAAVDGVAAQEVARPPYMIDYAAFHTEPVDAQWSAGMERRILDELAQMTGLGLLSLQVECRSKRCRVQLTVEVRSPLEIGDRGPAYLIMNELLPKLGLVWQQHTESPLVGSALTVIDYLHRGVPIE
jgi:hypothetical protein